MGRNAGSSNNTRNVSSSGGGGLFRSLFGASTSEQLPPPGLRTCITCQPSAASSSHSKLAGAGKLPPQVDAAQVDRGRAAAESQASALQRPTQPLQPQPMVS